MHETTETSIANMRYPKSITANRTVARGWIASLFESQCLYLALSSYFRPIR